MPLLSSSLINPVHPYKIGTLYGMRGTYWHWCIDSQGKWKKGQIDGLGNHTGYDFICPKRTMVYAVTEGTIVFINTNPSHHLGNFFVHEIEGLYNVTYAHLSLITCKEGDKVKQNDLLAESGATGNVTGAHLHISFRDKNGQWFDVNWPEDCFPKILH